jgi:hypothetical protein
MIHFGGEAAGKLHEVLMILPYNLFSSNFTQRKAKSGAYVL